MAFRYIAKIPKIVITFVIMQPKDEFAPGTSHHDTASKVLRVRLSEALGRGFS